MISLTEKGFPIKISLKFCTHTFKCVRLDFAGSGRGKEPGGLRCDMSKKRVFLTAALVILAALLMTVTTALAADDPLKVSMELSNNKFSAPETISVSIGVTNVSDADMEHEVTLYYPSGKQVEEFGAPILGKGVTKTWSGTWTVTQNELDAGKITFKIEYMVYNDNNELALKKKNFSKRIIYTGGEPELSINRTITPLTAQKDQEISITYEIANTGAVDVTGVSIKENSGISGTSVTIPSIAAGETEKHTFTATMGSRDLTSAATVTYKAGGKTYTSRVEAATIKYGEVKLGATLKADKKGGAPGDTVKLTLTLKNTGTVDFTDVKVTDATLGEVFTGVTVPKGETVTLEKEITITESQDLQFAVTGVNETGEPVETATGRVSIIATDPTQQIVLSVEAEADREQVYRIPGTVKFTIRVHNESAVDVENIRIRAVDTTVYTFDSIPAGETRSVSRDMDISMAGTFQFTASAVDQLEQTLVFESNRIPITYAPPTPVPTEAPLVTPPKPATEEVPTDLREPEWLDQVESVASIARWVFAGLAGVLALLLLIGAIRRGNSRRHSNKAMDHLEGANYRDYSQQPKRGKRNVVYGHSGEEEPAEPETDPKENTVQDGELMAETLKRLYTEPEAGAETKAEPEAKAETEPQKEAAADQAAQETDADKAPVQAESAAEASHRRRSRK